jgi:hypothetical protein
LNSKLRRYIRRLSNFIIEGVRGCGTAAGDAEKLQGAGVRGFEWEQGSDERSSPPASTSGRDLEEETVFPMCDTP